MALEEYFERDRGATQGPFDEPASDLAGSRNRKVSASLKLRLTGQLSSFKTPTILSVASRSLLVIVVSQ